MWSELDILICSRHLLTSTFNFIYTFSDLLNFLSGSLLCHEPVGNVSRVIHAESDGDGEEDGEHRVDATPRTVHNLVSGGEAGLVRKKKPMVL